MKQSDPLRGTIFALAHYRTLLETFVRTFSCVFLSLANNTHIVGPIREIISIFDLFKIQLTLVGLMVKVIKMQVLKSIKDLFRHKDFLGLHFGHIWLTHFECANEFS
jgi:hypothetical protein